MQPKSFTKLGGKRRKIGEAYPKQLRSQKDEVATVSPTPKQFINQKAFSAPIFNQLQTPSCGAHAAAGAQSLLLNAKFTPRFTWIDMKQNGDDRNVDDGVDMPSIFKSLSESGVNVFEPLENDTTLSNAEYANPNAITPVMKTDAATRKIKDFAYPDVSEFSLQEEIYKNGAVITLIDAGDTMWTSKSGVTSWNENDVLPLRPPASIVDGHFIYVHSYLNLTPDDYLALKNHTITLDALIEKYTGTDEPLENITCPLFIFANSWGTDWGHAGHGYFGVEYMPYVLELGIFENPTITLPPDESVDVQAAKEQASGNSKLANILYALANFIKSFLSKKTT